MVRSDAVGCQRRLATPCGGTCTTCDALLQGRCAGCGRQAGETPEGACLVYGCCVVERGLEHCGLCLDLPCRLFLAHASPVQVARHYRALTFRAEVGTNRWLEEQESGDLQRR